MADFPDMDTNEWPAARYLVEVAAWPIVAGILWLAFALMTWR